FFFFFFFQAEDGIRDGHVTGVQTCALPIFGLTQALPGDVARMIVGQFYDPVAVDALRKDLGLNDPLYVQYGRWASHALQGDFGRSEERRVGKECRYGGGAEDGKEEREGMGG